MDISDTLRDPLGAAAVAALVTAGYIHIRAKMSVSTTQGIPNRLHLLRRPNSSL